MVANPEAKFHHLQPSPVVFTDAKIKALKPKSVRYEVWEKGRKGFGVRVSPLGRKSWVFMYWVDGEALEVK